MLQIPGSYDRTVRCWDFDSGECVRTFCGHERAVFCLVYLPSDTDSCYDSGTDDQSSVQVLDVVGFSLLIIRLIGYRLIDCDAVHYQLMAI